MADTKRLSTFSEKEQIEDFGYVERDSKILQKALCGESRAKPTVDNVNRSGSQVTREGPSPEVNAGTHRGEKAIESSSSGHNSGTTERKFEIVKESVLVRKFGEVFDVPEVKVEVKQSSPRVSEISNAESNSEKSSPRVSGSSEATKSSSKAAMSSKPREEQQTTTRIQTLPQSFQVKYLGHRDASGLWGIKHTRKPVDHLVTAARTMSAGTVLPMVRLLVSKEGVSVLPLGKNQEVLRFHAIDTISYGVQDLVYTRVFCITVVREGGSSAQGKHPFECHAFVCDSRHGARELTYALSAAFKEFSKTVKESAGDQTGAGAGVLAVKKKFAIDLRSPEEIEADLRAPEDSEA